MTRRRARRAAPGFTLVEVLVAISIFSIAITITFTLLSRATASKAAGRDYLAGVFVVDDFLLERRLAGDAAEWFIPRDRLALIRAGQEEKARAGDPTTLVYGLSNGGTAYELRCRAELLALRPLAFRAYVACRWLGHERGKAREYAYDATTAFVGVNAERSNVHTP